jgi:hypothetical protein
MTVELIPDAANGSLSSGASDSEPPSGFLPHSALDQPPPQSASGASAAGTTIFVVWVLMLVLAIILSINLLTMYWQYRTGRLIRESDRQNVRVREPVFDPRRIERRYETIEGWLITKKVQNHDAFCEKVVGVSTQRKDEAVCEEKCKRITCSLSHDTGKDEVVCDETCKQMKCSLPHDTAETDEEWSFGGYEEKECPICMECLEVDDVVSWSPNSTCQHFFHHECIKEWLLRHTECPMDRSTFLPIDREGIDKSRSVLQELSKVHSHRTATSYFCLHEGLVIVPDKADCTEEEFELIKMRAGPNIHRTQLAKIRGNRMEGTIRTSNKDVSTIDDNENEGGIAGQAHNLDDDALIPVDLSAVPDASASSVDEELGEVTDQ